MQYFDAKQVNDRLDFPALIDALAEGHQRESGAMEDMLLEQVAKSGTANHLLLRAAWQNGEAVGVKLVTVFPDNVTAGKGLASVQAVYVLFDGVDGKPIATIDGTPLTWRKTAADSALGSRFLSRDDSRSMLMVGAGSMAPHLIEAHMAVRPSIEHVEIWNRTPERAERLADGLRQTLPFSRITIKPVSDLESAVRIADLISCATMTSDPLIRGAWLKPGTHLDLVGAFTKSMREADDEAVKKSTVFVDSRLTTVGHIGEIDIPLQTGALRVDEIRGDLFQLARGEVQGRSSAEEITFFKNGGGGHLDLMCARFLVERSDQSQSGL